MNHGGIDHGITGLDKQFVVTAEATVAAQPSKRALRAHLIKSGTEYSPSGLSEQSLNDVTNAGLRPIADPFAIFCQVLIVLG